MDEITLMSKTNDKFVISKNAANMSQFIKNILEGQGDPDEPIQFDTLSTEILSKVVDYCKHHYTNGPPSPIQRPLQSVSLENIVSPWDLNFINIPTETLFELMNAANYLSIEPLLELTCAKTASMIKNKSPEEIRTTFNIQNDFTPEEERQVREENRWCEDIS